MLKGLSVGKVEDRWVKECQQRAVRFSCKQALFEDGSSIAVTPGQTHTLPSNRDVV